MGRVMKLATERAAGRADGRALSAAVSAAQFPRSQKSRSQIRVSRASSRHWGFLNSLTALTSKPHGHRHHRRRRQLPPHGLRQAFAPLAGKPVLWHS